MALLILVLLGVLAIPVSSLVRNGKSFWPKAWDARLAPIAIRDVQIRGLKYKHPVPVRFLPEAAFKKLIARSDGSDTGSRTEIERDSCDVPRARVHRRQGRSLRSDDSRPTKRASSPSTTSTRRRSSCAARRSTSRTARRSRTSSPTCSKTSISTSARSSARRRGRRAAGRVVGRDAGLDRGRRQPRRGELPEGSRPRRPRRVRPSAARGRATDFGKATADVPPFVQLLFSAPYELGPLTIRMLLADGGNSAVNAALTGPTPTSADFVQAGLIAPPPPGLPAPELAANEKAAGGAGLVRRVRAVRHARVPR